jgi:uncharacterized membrane protein
MTCPQALTILIAETDEHPRAEMLAARRHASRCPRCSAAYDPTDPDIDTADIFVLCGREAATSLRVGLSLISIAQLVFAVPWLFGSSLLPDSHVAVSHLTRDGALGLVIAALGLVTVGRPRYAHATRVMGFVVLGLQLVTGLADHDMHMVTGAFEIVHLLVVLIVAGLCSVAVDVANRATPRAEARYPVLHART